MGPIQDRTVERLGVSDRAVTANRRLLLRAIKAYRSRAADARRIRSTRRRRAELRGPARDRHRRPGRGLADALARARGSSAAHASPWAAAQRGRLRWSRRCLSGDVDERVGRTSAAARRDLGSARPMLAADRDGFVDRHDLWGEAEYAAAAPDPPRHRRASGSRCCGSPSPTSTAPCAARPWSRDGLAAGARGRLSASPSSLVLKDTSGKSVYPVFSRDAGIGIEGLGGAGDIVLVPDPKTFRVLPWAPNTGWVLCDLHFPDGRPRAVLRPGRSSATRSTALAARGYGVTIGVELEFHVFRALDEGARRRARRRRRGGPAAAPAVWPASHAGRSCCTRRTSTRSTTWSQALSARPARARPAAALDRARVRAEPAGDDDGAAAGAAGRRRRRPLPHRDPPDLPPAGLPRDLHVAGRRAPTPPRPGGTCTSRWSTSRRRRERLRPGCRGRRALSATGQRYLGGPAAPRARGRGLHHADRSTATSATAPSPSRPTGSCWGIDNKGAMVRAVGGAGRPGDAAGEPLRRAGRQPLPLHGLAAGQRHGRDRRRGRPRAADRGPLRRGRRAAAAGQPDGGAGGAARRRGLRRRARRRDRRLDPHPEALRGRALPAPRSPTGSSASTSACPERMALSLHDAEILARRVRGLVDAELVAEHRERPFGPHSPALIEVLDFLRRNPDPELPALPGARHRRRLRRRPPRTRRPAGDRDAEARRPRRGRCTPSSAPPRRLRALPSTSCRWRPRRLSREMRGAREWGRGGCPGARRGRSATSTGSAPGRGRRCVCTSARPRPSWRAELVRLLALEIPGFEVPAARAAGAGGRADRARGDPTAHRGRLLRPRRAAAGRPPRRRPHRLSDADADPPRRRRPGGAGPARRCRDCGLEPRARPRGAPAPALRDRRWRARAGRLRSAPGRLLVPADRGTRPRRRQRLAGGRAGRNLRRQPARERAWRHPPALCRAVRTTPRRRRRAAADRLRGLRRRRSAGRLRGSGRAAPAGRCRGRGAERGRSLPAPRAPRSAGRLGPGRGDRPAGDRPPLAARRRRPPRPRRDPGQPPDPRRHRQRAGAARSPTSASPRSSTRRSTSIAPT